MPDHQPDLLAVSTAIERPPDSDLVDRLPVARRLADRIPCSFHGRDLTVAEWAEAHYWYNTAVLWRTELGSDDASVRFNRAVLAAMLRVHRPWCERLPRHCLRAARAGIERVVWERTGRKIKLRQRCKPPRVPVPLFLRGIFQGLLL